jgi:hypothetical protein
MAVYAEAEDMINVGAYRAGSNPSIDEAIAKHKPIEDFLIQEVTDRSSLEDTFSAMGAISGVAIPPEELAGHAAKKSDGSSQVKIPVGGSDSQAAMNWQGNSVASLFASRMGQEGDSEL